MTCRMASIIGKNIRGNRYYYAREYRRVNGKPKIVWQKYLGRADDIIAVVTGKKTGGGPKPREAVVSEFGASAALYDLAQRLRIVEFIDHHVPKTPTSAVRSLSGERAKKAGRRCGSWAWRFWSPRTSTCRFAIGPIPAINPMHRPLAV